MDGHEGIADGYKSILVPADEDDSRPELCEGASRGTTEARGGTRDEDRPALERAGLRGSPAVQTATDPVADVRETPHDGDLEPVVDKRADVHPHLSRWVGLSPIHIPDGRS